MINDKKDFIKKLSRLKPEDKADLQFCMQQLETIIKTGVVSEDSVRTLYNLTVMLLTMKERHMSYVVHWLKQGFMEDEG